jgi:hypothetical protein
VTTRSKHSPQREKTDEERAHEHDVRTYLEWNAPGRPFIKRSREYFVNILLIMMAIEIILFLFGQYLLMLVVFSLVFLSFAISMIPPHQFYYKISSEGIRIEDYFYIWEELYDFFFIKHEGEEVLYLTTKDYFPGELKLTLGDMQVEEVKKALLPFLPYREYVKPTFMEKSGDWLSRNFPLEKKVQ